jgi:hypothetical protein
MPATGDRIPARKDGLFQGTYTAQTPSGPKRKYITGASTATLHRSSPRRWATRRGASCSTRAR